MSGYFKTPTAYVNEDGMISFGASIFNKKYQQYSRFQNHVGAAYITLGYIPRVELSLRITRKIDADYSSHVMDRMFSGKLLVIKEGEYIPAFSIGLQNPYSTLESANRFNSTYFVLSKTIIFSNLFSASVSLGRGFDWIKAADYEFIGFFGGAEIKIQPVELIAVSLIIENTALVSNLALKLFLFKHFAFLVGLEGLDALSVGSTIIFDL